MAQQKIRMAETGQHLINRISLNKRGHIQTNTWLRGQL